MKLKPTLLDVHTHTLASGHAYGTISETIVAAKGKGLEIIGISEHGPGIPGTCDPFYFNNLSVIPRRYEELELVLGCEINVLEDGTLSLSQQHINHLDYAIAGIHVQCYKDQGIKKNTQNVIDVMENPKLSIISHPDNDETPLDYDKLTDGAKEHRVALEVNNSAFRTHRHHVNCEENYKKMLGLCEKKGVYILFSSDAHHPVDVGGTEYIEKFFKEENIEFPEELILNYSPQKFRDLCLGR